MIDPTSIDRNLRRMLYCYGRVKPGCEIVDLGDVTIIYSAVPYSVFNIAMLSGPVADTAIQLYNRIEKARHYFTRRHVEWSFWFYDGMLSPSVQKNRDQILSGTGLNPVADLPGMWADRLSAPAHALPGIEYRPVEDDATRRDFTFVTSTSFHIPGNIASQLYSQEALWTGPFEGFVGYVRGYAVSTAGYIVDDDSAGIYSVGTIPEFRRKGYAEALIRRTLPEVLSAGCHRRLVLQSTRQGLALYRRMGFESVTRFSVYVSD